MASEPGLATSYRAHLERVRTFPDQASATRYFRRNHEPLLRNLPPGPLLDVGCGLGDFLVFCRDVMQREAKGIDLDAENVEFCRAAGLEADQADVRDFLRRPGQYSAVVLNDVIEHFSKPDILDLLSSIRLRLLSGGRLLLKTPNMSNPLTAARSLFMDVTHQTGFTEESLRQALEMTGYGEIILAPVDIYVTSNPVANAVGRALCRATYATWRIAFKVQGVPRVQVLTKGLIAVGTRAR